MGNSLVGGSLKEILPKFQEEKEFWPKFRVEIKNQVFGFGLTETETQILISVSVSFCQRYVSFALYGVGPRNLNLKFGKT